MKTSINLGTMIYVVRNQLFDGADCVPSAFDSPDEAMTYVEALQRCGIYKNIWVVSMSLLTGESKSIAIYKWRRPHAANKKAA